MKNENSKDDKEREVTHIELVWDSIQDLIDLSKSEHFSEFILLKSYDAITKAIEDNLDKVELFNIFNMSLIIELDRPNFPVVLNNITKYFISLEDYEECDKIKQLIDKL